MTMGIYPLIVQLVLCLGSLGIPSPHVPCDLTWQILNEAGEVVYSVSKIATPFTWWLDLFPDLCKLTMGCQGRT